MIWLLFIYILLLFRLLLNMVSNSQLPTSRVPLYYISSERFIFMNFVHKRSSSYEKSMNTNLSNQKTPIIASIIVPNTETTNHAGIWNIVHPVELSRNAVSTCHKKQINTTSSVAFISFKHCLCFSSFDNSFIIFPPPLY